MIKYFAGLFFCLTFFVTGVLKVNSQELIPAWFCISEEEYALFNYVNDFRKTNFLSPVPLSKSLSYVARQHVNDLNLNKPYSNVCSYHSWSDGGKFQGCCFDKNDPDFDCMRKKPKEITRYKGDGYELVYWENGQVYADAAIDEWKTITPSKDMILNRARWQEYTWNAMGIAVEGNFALVWFGTVADTGSKITVCGTDNTITSRPEVIAETKDKEYFLPENNRSYVVVGSFTSIEEAKKEYDRCKSKGYQETKIIFSEGKYRVSAGDFTKKDDAQRLRNKITNIYKSAWVMTF